MNGASVCSDKKKAKKMDKWNESCSNENRRTKMMKIGGASKELEEIKCNICTILGSH